MVIATLEAEKLSAMRGDRRLFEAVSFTLSAGEALALTGPNGSGKTTLLRMIAGFIAPSEGALRFRGPDGPIEAAEARSFDLHLLGHQDGLKGGRLAREEVVFQALWMGGDAPSALAAAERLGLGRVLALPVRNLSAGQRRRLALARLIAARRSLWLLDEPLAPLDAEHRALFGELMGAHLAGGGLIAAAVHDPLPIVARSLELDG